MFYTFAYHPGISVSPPLQNVIMYSFAVVNHSQPDFLNYSLGGVNLGVMKAVGQAVLEGQSMQWGGLSSHHRIRCIGIATWGYVERNEHLICPSEGKVRTDYCQKNFKLVDLLNSFSPHGEKLNYHCISVFRAAIQPHTEWSIHLREGSLFHSILTTPISSWWMMGHRVNVEPKRFSSEHDWKEPLLINQIFRDKVKWFEKRSVTLIFLWKK